MGLTFISVYNKLKQVLNVLFNLSGGIRTDDTLMHEALREALAKPFSFALPLIARKISLGCVCNYMKKPQPHVMRLCPIG